MPGIAVCNSPILACGSPPPWTPAAWGADRLVDYTADDVLLNGAAVTAFVDQTGTANATQANAAFQGVLTTDANLGGATVVALTLDGYRISGAAYAGTSWSVLVVIDNVGAMADVTILYDTKTPRRQIALRGSGADVAMYYDGSYKALGAATIAGAVSRVISLDAPTTTAKLIGPAGDIGTSNMLTPGAIGGNGALFTSADWNDMYMPADCKVGRFAILKRATTAADLALWFAWSAGKYGV